MHLQRQINLPWVHLEPEWIGGTRFYDANVGKLENLLGMIGGSYVDSKSGMMKCVGTAHLVAGAPFYSQHAWRCYDSWSD